MEGTRSKYAPAYCPDCGPASVFHFSERWSARLDAALGAIQTPFNLVRNATLPFVARLRPGRLIPPLAAAAAFLRIGTLLAEPDEEDNWRTRVLWEEAARRGIVMKEFRLFGLSRDLFFATYRNDTRGFDGLPRPRRAPGASLAWMDNKGVIIKKFAAGGVPVPKGRNCSSLRQAEEVFTAVHGPVIVKPSIGSRSRHTYLHITDREALKGAFKKAKQLCPWVAVEEELSGFVFRITLVNGKAAGVMRREPPHVIGDGIHTVQQLVDEENKNPLRHGPIFHELMITDESNALLKEQGLTLESVPAKGRMVTVHPKVSRSFGASTTEITDIHPDNQALFTAMAKVIDNPLVGIDFMIDDMARSWREQKCGVIECNSLPFIDLHHYPLKGPARNVAGAVWDMVFPTAPASS